MPFATREQKAEYDRSYNAINRGKKAEQNQRWAEANPGKVLAQSKRWREANPERKRASSLRWSRANREKVNAYSRLYYVNHHQQHATAVREWRERNRGTAATIEQRRRARRMNVPINDFTARQWGALKEAFRHRCAYCKLRIENLTQDHVIPLSRGGSHTASNIVPACRSCNARKNANAAPDFQPVLMMLAGKDE